LSGSVFGGPNQTVFTADPTAAFSLGLDLLDSQDENKVLEILKPIQEHIHEKYTEFSIFVSATTFPSWIRYYENQKDNTGAGRDELVTSRLVGEEALTADKCALKQAVDVILEKGDLIIGLLVGGAGLRNADATATSVQPGWRTSVLHLSKLPINLYLLVP